MSGPASEDEHEDDGGSSDIRGFSPQNAAEVFTSILGWIGTAQTTGSITHEMKYPVNPFSRRPYRADLVLGRIIVSMLERAPDIGIRAELQMYALTWLGFYLCKAMCQKRVDPRRIVLKPPSVLLELAAQPGIPEEQTILDIACACWLAYKAINSSEKKYVDIIGEHTSLSAHTQEKLIRAVKAFVYNKLLQGPPTISMHGVTRTFRKIPPKEGMASLRITYEVLLQCLELLSGKSSVPKLAMEIAAYMLAEPCNLFSLRECDGIGRAVSVDVGIRDTPVHPFFAAGLAEKVEHLPGVTEEHAKKGKQAAYFGLFIGMLCFMCRKLKPLNTVVHRTESGGAVSRDTPLIKVLLPHEVIKYVYCNPSCFDVVFIWAWNGGLSLSYDKHVMTSTCPATLLSTLMRLLIELHEGSGAPIFTSTINDLRALNARHAGKPLPEGNTSRLVPILFSSH